MLGSAWVALLRMRQMGAYNNLRFPRYALRRNHDDIVGAMSHDLDYFKRVFVQAGFIRSSNASGIMGLLGVSASEKAGQLLESLLTQISESTPQGTRQPKFHKFVEMLMREASTEDVGNRILHSYGMWEGLEKLPRF